MAIGAREFIESSGYEWEFARPRIGVQQVLFDYTPILIGGFVWSVVFNNYKMGGVIHPLIAKSDQITSRANNDNFAVVHITFKGVEEGSEWEDWAIANDVPVIGKTNN